MRTLTDSERISLRELLQIETNVLVKAEASQAIITDGELKKEAQSGIMACKGRINGLRQFINENNVLSGDADIYVGGGID